MPIEAYSKILKKTKNNYKCTNNTEYYDNNNISVYFELHSDN